MVTGTVEDNVVFLWYSSPVTRNTERLAVTVNGSGGFGATVCSITEGDVPGNGPVVMFVPSYGGDSHALVPSPVVKFLNGWGAEGRGRVVGVVAAGNRNFGATFAAGGREVARKLGVPVAGVAELSGMPGEIADVVAGIRDVLAG